MKQLSLSSSLGAKLISRWVRVDHFVATLTLLSCFSYYQRHKNFDSRHRHTTPSSVHSCWLHFWRFVYDVVLVTQLSFPAWSQHYGVVFVENTPHANISHVYNIRPLVVKKALFCLLSQESLWTWASRLWISRRSSSRPTSYAASRPMASTW